ncbi:Lar family restriction alleviation protein [Leclercia sp.]|uniref:Lar family restriction alleviation protein n=1 Tax=Leclercia sp. TaxID=1898428 RepID=UPI00289DED58|nr:Lar family restriction alleviation protein [Leclercia sp.]
MAEFTKEELIRRARFNVMRKVLSGKNDQSGATIDARLAEIALAALTGGMGQEPVAWVMKDDLADIDIISTPAYPTFSDATSKTIGELIPLYAAPQLPQPAVPDENGLLRCPFCGSAARVVDNRLGFYVQCCSDNCDGIAIGPRAPELQSEQEEKSIDWEALAQAAKDKWNRRAAMLQGAGPVQSNKLRDGWVAVPVEPTAEMYDAGDQQLATKQVWDAMIAAAPQQDGK